MKAVQEHDLDPFQIIGIGINVNGDHDDWPADLRDSATSIWQERKIVVDRNRLLAQLLLELEQCLDELAIHGTNRIALAYCQRCSTIGHTVQATLANGDVVVGLAEGIGQDGSLRVRPTGVSLWLRNTGGRSLARGRHHPREKLAKSPSETYNRSHAPRR